MAELEIVLAGQNTKINNIMIKYFFFPLYILYSTM